MCDPIWQVTLRIAPRWVSTCSCAHTPLTFGVYKYNGIIKHGCCRHRVLYDYEPRHADELELHEGDLVTVMRRYDDGWCVGVHARTSCVGTFPGNYVS